LKLVPRFEGQFLVNLFVKFKNKSKNGFASLIKLFYSLTLDHKATVIKSLCSV